MARPRGRRARQPTADDQRRWPGDGRPRPRRWRQVWRRSPGASALAVLAVERNRRLGDDAGAIHRRAAYAEGATDPFEPLAVAQQPKAPAFAGETDFLAGEADAVVV